MENTVDPNNIFQFDWILLTEMDKRFADIVFLNDRYDLSLDPR